MVVHRVPLAQTNLVGVACGFAPMARQEDFPSGLRHGCQFIQTATDLKPAEPCQLAVYAGGLEPYAAVSEAYQQRADVPR